MNSIFSTSFLFLLLPLLWGCSAHKSYKVTERVRKLKKLTVYTFNAKPSDKIVFKRDGAYGSISNVLIGGMGDIAIDNSGRVFISDFRQYTIDVFEPNGHYLTHIGRKGRGPGEFMTGPALSIISHQLYASDLRTFRISAFSLDSLRLTHTINLNLTDQGKFEVLAGYYLHQLIPENDGRFLVCFAKPINQAAVSGEKIDTLYLRYCLMDKKGRLIPKQVFKLKGMPVLTGKINGRIVSPTNFPFLHKPLVAVSEDGFVYTANSEEFLIKEYSPDGRYLRAFYYPYKRVVLTRKMAMESQVVANQYVTKYRQSIIRQNDLPKTWPALSNMKIDDQNHLWISTIVKNQKVYQWWVLNQKGKLLARFTWPRDKPIKVVKNGYLYTKETNNKTGMEQIVRYRIRME